MQINPKVLGITVPAAAFAYSTLVSNVSTTITARGDSGESARHAIDMAQIGAAAIIVGAAATQGLAAAIGAAIAVGVVALYYDRYLL